MNGFSRNSLLLLVCGFLTGAVFAAVVATDILDATVRGLSMPSSIDSGWGALIGSVLSGLFAVSLFWIQRLVDIRDRRRSELRECQQLSESVRQIITRTLRHQDSRRYDEWKRKFADKSADRSLRLDAIGLMLAHTNSMKLDMLLVRALVSDFKVGATVSQDVMSNLNALRQGVSTFVATLEEHYARVKGLLDRHAEGGEVSDREVHDLVGFTKGTQRNLEAIFSIAFFLK
tara:strand:+ start:115 stop:807 length:693 start_codon:yes stop_codon:yes gene_type:complete